MLTVVASALCVAANADNLRPPSVPLVTFNPYLSVWSPCDHLTDGPTQHWTGRENSLVSLIRIDGENYRLMGNDPSSVPAFPQTELQVLPTRSIYQFDNSHVHVTLTFMTAALPSDINALAQPLSYITWQVKSVDGVAHTVSVYDSASSELAVNETNQSVTWSKIDTGKLTAVKVGTEDQNYFYPAGDDTRIDWGYAYLAASSTDAKSAVGSDDNLLQSFIQNGDLPLNEDTRQPRRVSDETPVMALTFDLGSVGSQAVSRHAIVAYDEIYSIKWFGARLRPYWRRNGETPEQMLNTAEKRYDSYTKRCASFDSQLMADMTKVGGDQYAQICALAYRQSMAACGLVADANGQPLFLPKENSSNGDIDTVDVFFPMDPVLIFMSPSLAKATLAPMLAYAASPHWTFPNAPHDLGTYPIAEGRDDGGEAMPVEESGNMLILCDAVAHADGNAKFVAPWWPQLTQWAKFLEQYGLDPGDQLCTDDFMGHLAHNSNLSIKAIVALASYADLCKMRGDTAGAEKYFSLAKTDAAHWADVGYEGDHSLLAFDQPKTWSQKYNLVWDHILGLNIFPSDIAAKEIAYYKTKMHKYGLPLDSRTTTTKTDWSFWSASMSTDQADFESFIGPIYGYLNATTARLPLTDWYNTDNLHDTGFKARPVVGGLFIKMLDDKSIWKKWASKDKLNPTNWAPVPAPPVVTPLVATSEKTPQTWKYSTDAQSDLDWTKTDFDDSNWKSGPGGFGTTTTSGIPVGTVWNSDDIWLRRQIVLPEGDYTHVAFSVYHDDDVEIYVNGVKASEEPWSHDRYVQLDVSDKALPLFKPGATITVAVHCHQRGGGQGIDVGISRLEYQKP